ncbi:hypothetical protein DFH05DRAFT_1375420, partial [Lentinula detonsa]
PDIRKTGLTEARWLLSRKRTRNLFDLASSWKKEVINRIEVDISAEVQNAPVGVIDPDMMDVD